MRTGKWQVYAVESTCGYRQRPRWHVPNANPGYGLATEKHYRANELAELWGVCPNTIRRMFAAERGVLQLANFGRGKRKYSVLLIPKSVALRVHERLSNQTLQTTFTAMNPLRIVRLGDLNTGMSKKPGKVIKLHPPKQRTHRERVA